MPLHEDPMLPAANNIVLADGEAIMRLTPQRLAADVRTGQTRTAAGTFVGSLRINPALLTRPAEPIINERGAILGVGLPRDMARIQLDLAGEQFDLFFFDEQRDEKYGLRHVTMKVVNQDGAYARFSIDDRNGLVYGTIHTAARTVQILPGKQPGQQEAYVSDPTRMTLGSSSAGQTPRMQLLAWRHRQLEEVARLRSEHAEVTYESRSTYLQGGNLGRLRRVDAQELISAATRLRAITQFTGAESFQIFETLPTAGGGQRIRFQQLIGGIPVEAFSEVVIDESLQILRLGTVLAPRDAAPARPLLSESDAWRRAVIEWEAREADKLETMGAIPKATLVYRRNASTDKLELSYRFRFTTRLGLEYLAYTSAMTGAAEIANLFYQNFPFQTCQELTIGPVATGCPAPASADVLPARLYAVPPVTNYNCGPPLPQPPPIFSFCNSPGNVPIFEVLNDLRSVLPAAAGTNPPNLPACCSQLGTVQAVNGSRLPGGSSATAAGTIFIAGSDGSSREIVAHEFAHVYTLKYNDRLAVPDSLFASSFVEGIADTIAGIYGKLSNNPAAFGPDPWAHGDGAGYVGAQRSGSNNNFKFWQDIKKGVDPHDGGQVFIRFFRRLQESTGVGFQRLLGIALGTAASLRDLDGNGVIDAGDFRQTVLGTLKPEETALKNAVRALYAELYNATAAGPLGPPLPVGDPGPDGSPFAPAFYAGSFLNCGTFQGSPVTVYQTSWTPSVGATAYGLYVRGIDDAGYRHTDTAPGTQTTSFIFTNIPGDGRINACNAAGCSGLTVDRVIVSHLPQCGGG